MTLSLYEGRARQGSWPIVLMAVNLLFAAACMFWWSVMSLVVADAMSWATWAIVAHSTNDFFQYPFVLLWTLPLTGTALAWLGLKVDNQRFALAAAAFPPVLLGIILGWYHLAPLAWR